VTDKIRFGQSFSIKADGPASCGKSTFLYAIKDAVIKLNLPFAVEQVGDHILNIRCIEIRKENKKCKEQENTQN